MERRIMLLALVPMLIISGVDGGLHLGISGGKEKISRVITVILKLMIV